MSSGYGNQVGRILHNGKSAGSCFGVAPFVVVTASHVLDEISATVGDSVEFSALNGAELPVNATVLAKDRDRDLAILRATRECLEPIEGIVLSDSVSPFTRVTVTGVAAVDDGCEYNWLDAAGEWQGSAQRDDLVHLGRIESKAVVKGMSGSPVRRSEDDLVVGIVTSRYNSWDGWLRDSVWVVRTEDLLQLLRQVVPPSDLLGLRVQEDSPPPDQTGEKADPRLPSHWQVSNMPARNPNFTGRHKELTRLSKHLTSRSKVVTVESVRGMGGIGKTQLAIEYAYVHSEDYKVVWWVASEKAISIADQFGRLINEFSSDDTGNYATDTDKYPAIVDKLLQGSEGWLLIFDNAEESDVVEKWRPKSPQRSGVPGHVIVTTRRKSRFKSLGTVLDLDVIGKRDAVKLLRTRVKSLNQAVGEAIAEDLGWLPLALEQAAAYIDRLELPPEKYLKFLHERAAEMYKRGLLGSPNETAPTTWTINLDQAATENLAAMQLLEICAYLAPEPVLTNLFTRHYNLLTEPLASVARDDLALDEAIGTLVGYSLTKQSSAGLQTHRLIQAAIRSRCEDSKPAGRSSGSSLPITTEPAHAAAPPLEIALRLLAADASELVASDQESWPRWLELLPHVLAVTRHLDSGTVTGAALPLYASLLTGAGSYLTEQGQFSEAQPLLNRALAAAETLHGPEHPSTAPYVGNLAWTSWRLGNLSEAKERFERAIAVAEAEQGPKPSSIVAHLTGLAYVLNELGEEDRARLLVQRALAINPTIDLSNLAEILQGSSDLDNNPSLTETRIAIERELAIATTNYGPGHPQVAVQLNNLATMWRNSGDLAAALPLVERALDIDEKFYGRWHPKVAIRAANVGTVLWDSRDPAAARPFVKRALDIVDKAYHANHPGIAIRLNNLAVLLEELGELANARELYERARNIEVKVYGPENSRGARVRQNLARVLEKLGDCRE